MSETSNVTTSPHNMTGRCPHTVANALAAIEHKYESTPQQSPSDKRLLAALRTTCRRLSVMFGLPLESIHLDNLVGIDARLIKFNKLRGLSTTRAVQYACDTRKLLDLAHEVCGWSCRAYEIRKSWMPILRALKGNTKGCLGIIKYAIDDGKAPSDFTEEVMENWKQSMRARGLSLLTVRYEEGYLRTLLRTGYQDMFPGFSLASKNPPKYRLRLKDRQTQKELPDLPDPLRQEILDVIWWKTVDEDLPDRKAEWLIRTATAYKMMRTFVELYSCATVCPEAEEIVDLKGLISEKPVAWLIDLLRKDNRCKPQTIVDNLSSIYNLTQTYPKLKGDFRWFRARLDDLRKEKNVSIQARKLDGIPEYESIAQIPSKLLAIREDPDGVFSVDVGWIYHDSLLILMNLANPHRSRNIREAAYDPHEQLNIFETNITTELMSHLKLPRWAKEVRNSRPATRFLVGHWLEDKTKAGHEVWEIFPSEILPIFRKYVQHYRPLLLDAHRSDASTLFFARNGKPLSEDSLLDLVKRISARHSASGEIITVKAFRDLVGAYMLSAQGGAASIEDVAERLWNLDPYSTTARHYVGAFDASDGVIALEDELAELTT